MRLHTLHPALVQSYSWFSHLQDCSWTKVSHWKVQSLFEGTKSFEVPKRKTSSHVSSSSSFWLCLSLEDSLVKVYLIWNKIGQAVFPTQIFTYKEGLTLDTHSSSEKWGLSNNAVILCIWLHKRYRLWRYWEWNVMDVWVGA